MGLYGTPWPAMGSLGTLWHPISSLATQWAPMGSLGTLWHPMAPYGFSGRSLRSFQPRPVYELRPMTSRDTVGTAVGVPMSQPCLSPHHSPACPLSQPCLSPSHSPACPHITALPVPTSQPCLAPRHSPAWPHVTALPVPTSQPCLSPHHSPACPHVTALPAPHHSPACPPVTALPVPMSQPFLSPCHSPALTDSRRGIVHKPRRSSCDAHKPFAPSQRRRLRWKAAPSPHLGGRGGVWGPAPSHARPLPAAEGIARSSAGRPRLGGMVWLRRMAARSDGGRGDVELGRLRRLAGDAEMGGGGKKGE